MTLPRFSVALVASLLFVTACSSSSGGGSSNGGDGGSTGSPSSSNNNTSIYCEKSAGSDVCTCVGGATKPTQLATCTSTQPANSYCCADATYPTSGTCQCVPWSCSNPGGALCLCGIQEQANASPDKCTQSLCCAHVIAAGGGVNSCSCDNLNTSCKSDEQVVASCDLTAARCGNGQILVSACTQ